MQIFFEVVTFVKNNKIIDFTHVIKFERTFVSLPLIIFFIYFYIFLFEYLAT